MPHATKKHRVCFPRLPLPVPFSADACDDDDAADGAMTARKHFNTKRRSHTAVGRAAAALQARKRPQKSHRKEILAQM